MFVSIVKFVVWVYRIAAELITAYTVHLFFIRQDLFSVFVCLFCFPDMTFSNPWVVCKHTKKNKKTNKQ